jgi:hypothetical protein
MPQLEQAVSGGSQDWRSQHDAPRARQNKRVRQAGVAADIKTVEEKPQLRLVQPLGDRSGQKVRLHRQFLCHGFHRAGPAGASEPRRMTKTYQIRTTNTL